jgi:hypothetical protein
MLKGGAPGVLLGVAHKKDLRKAPTLTIIESLLKRGTADSYNRPCFPFVSRGCKYNLKIKSAPLQPGPVLPTDSLGSDYDYRRIVQESLTAISPCDGI